MKSNVTAPLKLDNRGLLAWVRYMDASPKPKSTAFDSLTTLIPAYQELYDNKALLVRLRRVLEADERVFVLNWQLDQMSRWARLTRRKFVAEQRAVLAKLKDERGKAHEAYEMLRRLSYQGFEGAIFEIEFTNS